MNVGWNDNTFGADMAAFARALSEKAMRSQMAGTYEPPPKPPERHLNPGQFKIGKRGKWRHKVAVRVLDGGCGVIVVSNEDAPKLVQQDLILHILADRSWDRLVPLRRLVTGGAFKLNLSP